MSTSSRSGHSRGKPASTWRKIWGSADLTRSIGLPEGLRKLQIGGRAAAAGSEEKFLAPTAQSLRQKEIGEITAADDVPSIAAASAAAVPIAMAVSFASIKGAAGSEEKGPTSPAGAGCLRAIMLVLTAVVAVAVPILLLVYFQGHHMSQVWILSLSICLDVFFFLLFIWRSQWYYTDFARLSYGPLLAFFCATAIGSVTATFVLFFSMVWAAGNLGYSLAVHRLRKGTELAIHVAPSPSCPTKDSEKHLSFGLHVGVPFLVLLSTLFMAFILNVATVTDELDILFGLSFFGWINVAASLIFVAVWPMHAFHLEESIGWLMAGLPSCLLLSPLVSIISQILSALYHLLLMLALVAILWYNLAIYMHFLATATPSTTTRWNDDYLRSKILEDKIGQLKSDRTTSSEAAAALWNEDTLHSEILEDKIGQVKSDPKLGTTLSETASTLGNDVTLHSEILEGKLGQVKSDPRLGRTPSEAAPTLLFSS